MEAQAEVSTLTVLTPCPTHLGIIHSDDQQVFVALIAVWTPTASEHCS